MKESIDIQPENIVLSPEHIKLMNVLLEVYEIVKRKDSLFLMAVRITSQAKTKEEAETILKGLKLFMASPYCKAVPELKCSICGNYAAILINNEFFKQVCSKCAEKMKGEFFHITPKNKQSC